MKDANYVQKMRQDLIKKVFTNLDSNSTFTVQTNDGSDALVKTIDQLIDA